MRIKDSIKIAFVYFMRGKLRSALTVAAIAIGISAVIIMGTLGESGKRLIEIELRQLGINGITVYKSSGSNVNLSPSDAQNIASRLENVSAAMPLTFRYSSYKLHNVNERCLIWGIDENLEDILSLDLSYGRPPLAFEIRKSARIAIIDESLALRAYSRENIIGKTISLAIGGAYESFEVIGIVSGKSVDVTQLASELIPCNIYVPYTSIIELSGNDHIDQIAIACASGADSEQVGREAVKLLSSAYRGSGAVFSAQDIGGYKEQVSSVLDMLTLFLSAVAAISLCVAGLGIMNSMLATTRERYPDIGICMAIGARPGDIALSYLAEAAIIAAFGGLIGVLLGLGLCLAVCGLLGITPVIKAAYIIGSELVAISFGLIFGVVPAIKAARLDPIKALK